MKSCTIIMPIYNAYDATKAAIESVIQHTDLKTNKLLLINDKSTDERIGELLSSYQGPNIIIQHNQENLGFVKTVNIGMKFDKNDVLLLNSDTEVTANWLEKIKNCAYQDDNIATVTPLSNNATLASVPKAFVPSVLPEGYSLDKMAELVENCSYKEYPEIPTGHGFCLFIKRDVLNKVGYFDEESFGKGYGEESDFCYRCFNYGYRHVLCDDTYIYHKESQSFTDSKIERIKKAGEIIEKRYPSYLSRLNSWCQRKPHRYIGDNIGLHLGAVEPRPNILFIIHDWDKNNLGGTTLHADDIVQTLRNKYNFHIFTKNRVGYAVYSYYEQTETKIQLPDIEEFKDLRYYNSEYQKLLEKIIDMFQISIVHIHHLKGHYFNIKNIINKYKLYIIIGLHDYYSICPQITKLYKNEQYCGCTPNKEKCAECLRYLFKNDLDIDCWRHEWHSLLKSANKIIVPSESTKKEINKIYQDLGLTVIEHGINIKKETSKLQIDINKNFNVAFVGAIGIHKGSKILEEFIKRKDWKNIKLHLFGILDSPLQKNTKFYINHGRYKREELKEKLKKNNIQLICLLSTVPETYSYSLSESIACGIPVLAFNIGALGERVKKSQVGWLIDANSTCDQIIQKIREIASNPEQYTKIVDNINKTSLKTVNQMANDYHKIYKSHVKETLVKTDIIKEYLRTSRYYHETSLLVDSSAWVFSTLKWKIISKLKIPKPVKKIGKTIINKAKS